LRAELDRALVEAPADDGATLRAFRRFRLSHMLRVGINDVLRDRPIEEITRDLSRVADTSIQIAYERAWRVTAARFGEPVAPDGEKVRGCCLAFGKLGGEELNYSSDIDLMFLFDREGTTQGGRMHLSAGEFFAKLSAEVIRLLAAPSDAGAGYRVDLRLRPDGGKGPVARDLLATMAYYDSMGRTWERQALIKVRPVAGDVDLGREFLQAIEPFIYRKYLSFAEINEIKALKRRI
jgi:glutamate-ammonia-ligase adenylyltransferase